MKLKEVRLLHPIPFNGPSTLTLMSKDAEKLELELDYIVAKRKDRDAVFIPLHNVIFYKELEEAPAPAAKPDPNPEPEPVPEAAPAVEPAEVVRFEKDAKTGKIREVAAKVAAAKAGSEE